MERPHSALLLALVLASPALAAEPLGTAHAHPVEAGRLFVDGRWLTAPLLLRYTLDPPAVFCGGVLVARDDALTGVLGFLTTPATLRVEEATAFRGNEPVPIAWPRAHDDLGALATRLAAHILASSPSALEGPGLRAGLGRFLIADPSVAAARERGSRLEVYVDPTGRTTLSLPRLEPERVAAVHRHVAEVLGEVARRARASGIYRSGKYIGSLTASSLRLVDRLAESPTARGGAPWLVRVLTGPLGAFEAASAVGELTGRDPDADAFPRGVPGLRIERSGDEWAIACRDVALSDVATAIENATAASVSFPFVERARSLTFFSEAFEALPSAVAALAEDNGLRVGTRPDGTFALSSAPLDLAFVPRAGALLWTTDPLRANSRWGATLPSVFVHEVTPGVLGAHRFGSGRTAWRRPLGGLGSLFADADRLVVTTREGAVLFLSGGEGRIEWSQRPPFEISPLDADPPPLRAVAATGADVVVLQGSDRLLSLAREGGSLRRVQEIALGALGGAEGVHAFTTADRFVLLDDEGAIAAVREGAFGARDPMPVAGGYAVRDGDRLLVIDRSLTRVAEIPFGTEQVFASDGERLVVAGPMARARVHAAPRWAVPAGEVEIGARPTAAFAAAGDIYVAARDGAAYRIDAEEISLVGLAPIPVPVGGVVTVRGVGVFTPRYGGRLSGGRVR